MRISPTKTIELVHTDDKEKTLIGFTLVDALGDEVTVDLDEAYKIQRYLQHFVDKKGVTP